MTSKRRRHNKGTRRKSKLFNKPTLLKRYPNLMKKLLGKNMIGGNELERLNIVSKLSICLLFDNANNSHLIKLKSDILSEGSNMETLIDRAIERSDKKISSPAEYSVKIFKIMMEIRNMKDINRKYEDDLRKIARAIDRFDRFFTQKKRTDDRQLSRSIRQSARVTARQTASMSRQSARESDKEKRQKERAERELARASRKSSRM